MGWITPVSLLASIAVTSVVSGRSKAGKSAMRITPCAVDGDSVDGPAEGRQVVGEGGDAGVFDGGDDDVGRRARAAEAALAD